MYGLEIIVGYLLVINIVAYTLFGVDKKRAINNQWRVQERTLWIVSVIGGVFGSWIGMRKFRHKTKHLSFLVLIPLLAFLYLFFFAYMLIKI